MGPLGRPKRIKNNKQAKPNKGQRRRPRKNHNSQSTESREDVGPQVELLLAEQNSDGGEELAETESAVLDPRFKKCWIAETSMSEHTLLNSDRFELNSRYSKLKDDESESHSNSTNKEQHSANQESGPTPSKKKCNLNSTINTPKRTPSAGSAKILDEFEVYLSEPNIHMEVLDDSGVLQPTRALKYWKLHSRRFPFLSLVARDINGCPASSASIERAFSTAANGILTAKRARTKSYLFQQLLFLKHNSNLFDC